MLLADEIRDPIVESAKLASTSGGVPSSRIAASQEMMEITPWRRLTMSTKRRQLLRPEPVRVPLGR